ncbi:hypothetical protein [Lachnospira multipara]|uniref:hypothetical protein n=1 Tax=Lachnospira multipara TaxID=28051 RepID=UPI000482B1B7|nr:hypothetical protein [Lachnospira multipara]
MLCPKCGKEYEGAQCPNCDGPVILVNNSDYLARKKAYEEGRLRQTDIPTSSRQDNKGKENEDKEFDVLGAIDGFVGKIRANSKTAKSNSKNKKSNKNTEENNKRKENNLAVTFRKRASRYNFRRLIFFACLLVIIVAVAILGFVLFTRKNYELFFSYNDKIYNVTNLESKYVCEESDAIFAKDDKTFYSMDGIELNGQNIQKLSSNNGEYMGFVNYDEESQDYSIDLYLDGELQTVVTSDKSKEIVCLLDSGVMVYTETVVLNEEGGMGEKTLNLAYIHDGKITTSLLSEDVNKYFVYTSQNLVIFVNNDGEMSEYNYKTRKVTSLGINVTNIIAMSSDYNNCYTYSADLVNEWDKCDSFVYTVGFIYYRYDLKTKKAIQLMKSTDSNMEFVYDATNNYVYALNTNTVYCASISNGSVSNFENLCDIKTGRNSIFLNNSKELLVINTSNELVLIKKGETKVLDSGVLDGSLSLVGNTTRSVSYIKDNGIYYLNLANNKAIKVYEGNDLSTNTGMVKYKNSLYFYGSNNTLFTTTMKGSGLNNIGDIKKFWLGTKLK